MGGAKGISSSHHPHLSGNFEFPLAFIVTVHDGDDLCNVVECLEQDLAALNGHRVTHKIVQTIPKAA